MTQYYCYILHQEALLNLILHQMNVRITKVSFYSKRYSDPWYRILYLLIALHILILFFGMNSNQVTSTITILMLV
jgi:hypothetical protein